MLRIEDTDEERNTPEAIDALIEGLRWLGLDWDEGPGAAEDPGALDELWRGLLLRLLLREAPPRRASHGSRSRGAGTAA